MIRSNQDDQRPSKTTKVIYGANDDEFDLAGATVGSVRDSLVDAFNISSDALAFADGVQVHFGHRLLGGETLEFCKQSGKKGLGRLLSPKDLMEWWGIDRDQYECWIAEGLPTEQLVDGTTAHFELAVDQWCRTRMSVKPKNSVPPARSKWLRLKDAAVLLGISTRQLARYADHGKIAHKRKPGRGRGGRGEYLFLPEEVERLNVRMTIPAKMDRTTKPSTRPIVKTKVFIDPKLYGRSLQP